MDYGVFSLFPIFITLVLVFIWKNVFLALLAGILSASVIVGCFTGDFLCGPQSIATVFQDESTAMTTFFVLMTGAVMTVVSRSGGVEGLVRYTTEKRKLVRSPMAAQLLSFVLGLLLFVDGTSSIAIVSMVGKPFFRTYKIPREKLALIANSTGSAVAWIVPFGSACAVLTTFFSPVSAQLGLTQDPFSVVLSSVVFQFYTIALLLFLLLSILFRFQVGAMKTTGQPEEETKAHVYETRIKDRTRIRACTMLVPVLLLVLSIFSLLLITGQGNLASGDGGTAVFVSGLFTLLVTGVWYRVRQITTVSTYTTWCVDGMKKMFDLVLILVLAYAFGHLLSTLGTASFLAQYAQMVPKSLMLVVGYLTATLIAYATGTSGGTAAVLVPVLVPVFVPLGIPAPYVLGAIISGAVFGDQNSPISDSVILTSSMTGVRLMDHVKTQMPYTLVAWGTALLGYLLLGFTCV